MASLITKSQTQSITSVQLQVQTLLDGAVAHAVEISFDPDRGMRQSIALNEEWNAATTPVCSVLALPPRHGQAGPLRPRRRKWAHVTNSRPVCSTQASPRISWGV